MHVSPNEMAQCRRAMRAVLDDATAQRSQRERLVDGPRGPEMEWQQYERRRFLEAVNLIRRHHGHDPVPASTIEAIDSSAAGHVDWADKMVLRLADLALTPDPSRAQPA